MEFVNDNTLATGATVLTLRQDAKQTTLFIVSTASEGVALIIDSEATIASVFNIPSPVTSTGNVFLINAADALTTGHIAQFTSDSPSTSTRQLMFILNNNALATGATCLTLRQDAINQIMILDHNGDGDGAAYFDFQGATGANATSPVSTHGTSGATTDHIQIKLNGTRAWIAVSTTDPTA